MEAASRVEALEEALAHHGRPEIFNTDWGSQFTSDVFTGVLNKNRVAISMDGEDAWRDNVVVERLWRSAKYEEVTSLRHRSPRPAPRSADISAYNRRRPYSSLERQTAVQAYFTRLPQIAAA